MDGKQKLAKERTDWAEDRTLLANERTFAGWVRTALGAVVVAIGLHAVFRSIQPDWPAKAVATVFLAAALFTAFFSWRRAEETHRRLHAHDANAQPPRNFAVLTALLALGIVLTGVVLWSL
ncbi:YidH family protein [Tranquillimonas alkanivorans]|uniref:Putative membrane protein n=1 Tax=Tranquillimonas alkanivorans TaxID=441119 RepID=A0A1I5KNP9_9RHOB|nr:DUF202 domain-containing protein [Tranquillimonas alkanivorans]SFO86547.1 putative membrane protein [Tranquillimonas alkanivorans]